MMSLCRPGLSRSSSRNHATVPAKRPRLRTFRFMHSRHEGAVEQDGTRNDHQQMISIDEALHDTMLAVTQQARDGLGWLQHAFQDPDDFSAIAIGKMVSKEYGRHERPHTEQHMWCMPVAPSMTTSSLQDVTSARAGATDMGQHTATREAVVQVPPPVFSWGFGPPKHTARSNAAPVYRSPPSGPGFLLQQQQQQQHDLHE